MNLLELETQLNEKTKAGQILASGKVVSERFYRPLERFQYIKKTVLDSRRGTHIMTKKIISVLLLGALLSSFAGADPRTNVSSGLTAKGEGLAAHGYDVVAYFTEGAPVLGSAGHTAVFQGAAYRFSSARNLNLFKANPEKYAPQYGGFCAYGVFAGAKFDGDPRLWRVVDGKLYFNLNEDIRDKWVTDIPGHITKADINWKKIADKRPADL